MNKKLKQEKKKLENLYQKIYKSVHKMTRKF